MRKSDFSTFFAEIKPDNDKSDNLYVQLMRNIQKCIRSGTLHEGEYLPSQRDIAQALNISRVTVRKAIEKLVDQGLLVNRQGAGTIVCQAPVMINKELSGLNSFSEEMRSRGFITTNHWVMKQLAFPNPEERRILDINAEQQVYRLTRVRLANGLPLAFEVATIPASMIANIHNIQESLYDALTMQGNRPVKAKQRIKAINCEKYICHYLALADNDAVLYIERIGENKHQQVVEFTKSWYLSDRYEFNAELTLE